MNEEVFVHKRRTFDEAVLKGIKMAIGQPAHIAEEFAEVEGGVDIEEIAKKDNYVWGIGKVEHIKEESSREEPLHHNWIQNKTIEDAHP